MTGDPPAPTRSSFTAPQKIDVIPTSNLRRWIEPWYISYAILGALASGVALILIPIVVIDNGGSATQIGTAIAAQNFGALFAPFWGWLSDRFKDYRTVFFTGFILIGVGFLLFAFFNNPVVWHVGSFLIGFGTGASNTVAGLFVVEFTPPAEWGRRISWLQTFNAMGMVLGTAGAGLLRPDRGMLMAALLVIPALVIGGWGLPVPGGSVQRPLLRRLGRADLAGLVRHIEPLSNSVIERLHGLRFFDLKAVRKVLATPFGILLAGWLLFSFAISSFSSLYPVLMRSEFRLSVAHSSLLLSAATALSIPLYNVAGRLTTRRGPVQVLSFGMAVRIATLAGIGLLGVFHVPFAVFPAIVLFGLFQGIWPLMSVASNDLSASLAPFGKGAAMGLFSATGAIASAAGAIAGGAMADLFGYSSASLLAAVGTAAALACVFRLHGTGEPGASREDLNRAAAPGHPFGHGGVASSSVEP